jgi:hypothetical protein
MTSRIPSLFTLADFSEAELSAMVLDGDAYRVGECVSPIDEIPSAALRAAALATVIPGRLIAERRTAAWVWGALNDLPARYEVCADIGARTRPPRPHRLLIREVVILDSEVVDFDGLRVTGPVRTATDIARFTHPFTAGEAELLARLMSTTGITAAQCATTMDERRNLSNKRVALERLERAEAHARGIPSIDVPISAPVSVPVSAPASSAQRTRPPVSSPTSTPRGSRISAPIRSPVTVPPKHPDTATSRDRA